MEFRKSSLSPQHLADLQLGIKDAASLGSQFKVLNRVPFTEYLSDKGIGAHPLYLEVPSQSGDDLKFCVIDLETSGFSAVTNEIIEIGLLRGMYSPSEQRITSIDEVVCMLQQPSRPIEPVITEVTGLTDEALAGHAIDDTEVARMLEDVDLLIAHNASFDRSFFDARFPTYKHKVWACSSKGGDIDWKGAGHRSAALESLLLDYGYFYDAHRASIDCMATVWLLMIAQDRFAELLNSVAQPRYLVKANQAPFEVKDHLKAKGFNWQAEEKVWFTEIKSEENLSHTLEFMGELYPYGAQLAQVIPIAKELRHTRR